MVKCLAFDASAEQCSVALLSGAKMESRQSTEARSHSQNLLCFADDLLAQHNLAPVDLNFIACSIGPGSFTGLRIAFGIAQGLAYAADLPLLGISSLDAIAEGAYREMNFNPNTLLISALDARMGEVYWQAYNVDRQGYAAVTEAKISSPDLSINQIEQLFTEHGCQELVLVGPGAELLNNLAVVDALRAVSVNQVFPHANYIALLAQQKYVLGEYEEIARVELAYLRNSVSWNKRTKIRKSP